MFCKADLFLKLIKEELLLTETLKLFHFLIVPGTNDLGMV